MAGGISGGAQRQHQAQRQTAVAYPKMAAANEISASIWRGIGERLPGRNGVGARRRHGSKQARVNIEWQLAKPAKWRKAGG